MPLARFGGSAYDMGDVSAVVRRGDSLWRRGVHRMTVVIRGGVALDVDGEDADALRVFVESLPAYGGPADSDAPRTVIPGPGVVRPGAGEHRS